MTLYIWPFLLGIGKMLLPNLIRTAVPIVSNALIGRIAGPPQATQRAAAYEEEIEEFLDEEELDEEELDEGEEE